MATLTSHTLNGTDGTHAGGIEVTLINLDSGTTLFVTTVDSDGRVSETVDVSAMAPTDRYELSFNTGAYWDAQSTSYPNAIREIVMRFYMVDPNARYHMPVIFSPNSYSMWSSLPE